MLAIRGTRTFLSDTLPARVGLLALLLPAAAAAQTPPIKLSADYELKDGRPADMAAPISVLEAEASSTRVWIGQGQVLAAINLATQERVHSEDKAYPGTITAVEADTPNKYLFTAEAVEASGPTPGKNTIHWDGLPPVPYPLTADAHIDLANDIGGELDKKGSPTCGSSSFMETIQDMKFWAPTNKLVVITDRRILVIDCDVTQVQGPGGVLHLEYSMEIAKDALGAKLKQCLPPMAHSNAFGQTNEFVAPGTLHLALIGGNVIAFCTTSIRINGIPPTLPKKGYRGIVACNLNNFQGQPMFLDSTATQHPQYWDPFSGTLTPDPVNSVVRIDGLFDATLSKYFLYAACGPAFSLAGFDASALLGTGTGSGMPPPVLGALPSILLKNPDQTTPPLTNILVDPVDPQKLYVTCGLTPPPFANTTKLFRVDRTTGASDHVASDLYDGPVGDMPFVRRVPASGPFLDTLWTSSLGTVDYVRKVFNVGGAVGGTPPSQVGQGPGIYGCDGAVAIPEFDNSIYLPTFGGVLRCQLQRAGQPPITVDTSYSVADGVIAGTGAAGGQKNTEHLLVGRIGQARYLFAADGTGGFTSWLVNATTHNPSQDPVYVPPLPAVKCFGDDGLGNPAYSNEVAFYYKPNGTGGFRYFVLADSNVSGTIYLTQYEVTGGVMPSSLPVGTSFPENDPDVKGNGLCIAVTDGAQVNYAFVGAKQGFMAVNLDSGLVTPYKPQQNWVSYPSVQGIAVYGRTLFLSLTGPGGGAVAMFDFDPSTGTIGAPSGMATVILKGGVEVIDTSDPTFSFGGGGRCRRTSPTGSGSNLTGHLYSCATGGHLLDFLYTISASTFQPVSLTFVGRWNNPAYTSEMQDCHIYSFGPPPGSPPGTPDIGERILAVKNEQCFALVVPQ